MTKARVDVNCYGSTDSRLHTSTAGLRRSAVYSDVFAVCDLFGFASGIDDRSRSAGLGSRKRIVDARPRRDAAGRRSPSRTCSNRPATAPGTSANGISVTRRRRCRTARDSTARSATWAAVSTTIRTSSTGTDRIGTTCGAMEGKSARMVGYFGDLMVGGGTAFIEPNRTHRFFVLGDQRAALPLAGYRKWPELQGPAGSPDTVRRIRLDVDEQIGGVTTPWKVSGCATHRDYCFNPITGTHSESGRFRVAATQGPTEVRRDACSKEACGCRRSCRFPGIAEGEIREQMVTGCDWFPTIARFAA